MARLTEEARSKKGLEESLTEKLKDSKENERKLSQKLSVQTKLANLYKSQSEEHNTKVENLGKALNMLKECNRKQKEVLDDNVVNMLKECNRKEKELLENLDRKVSDISTAGLDVRGQDDKATNSQLRANIKYLRQEKDILAGRLELEEAENAHLKSQHDKLKKEFEEVKIAAATKDEEQKELIAENKKLLEEIAMLYNDKEEEDSSDEDTLEVYSTQPILKRKRMM